MGMATEWQGAFDGFTSVVDEARLQILGCSRCAGFCGIGCLDCIGYVTTLTQVTGLFSKTYGETTPSYMSQMAFLCLGMPLHVQ